MITDTEGIVLRQVKAMGGRRMISLFSQKYGKISVGTSLNEGGRNKTALSVKAFTYGKYELFKNRDNYNLNSGQVLKSYYGLGEDLDKYMQRMEQMKNLEENETQSNLVMTTLLSIAL